MRRGMPLTQCQLRPKGSDHPTWTVAISGGADGRYTVEPQEGLDHLRGEYDLVWPSEYTETVRVWGTETHEVGTPAPYSLERSRPDEPHPDCGHPWISTSGDIGGPAAGTCHGCGGKTTGPAALGAVEAFGVKIGDYAVAPLHDAPLIGITNGPFEFHRKQ